MMSTMRIQTILLLFVTALSFNASMVSCEDSLSHHHDNIFQSASAASLLLNNDSSSLTPTVSPPPPSADFSWVFIPSPQDETSSTEKENGDNAPTHTTRNILDELGMLKYFLIALGASSALFWLYVYYRNLQYFRRTEETRLVLADRRSRRKRRRQRRRGSEPDVRELTLSELFDFHSERDLPDIVEDDDGDDDLEDMELEDYYDTSSTRHEQIVKRFYFQTVLQDKALSETIRSSCQPRQDDDEENPKDDASTHTNSTTSDTSSNEEEQQQQDEKNDWFQSLRKTLAYPRHQCDSTCCICLEDYLKGQTVCVPITKQCNHVFHEECMVAWLEKHNDCPLCRVDLMQDEDEDEDKREES